METLASKFDATAKLIKFPLCPDKVETNYRSFQILIKLSFAPEYIKGSEHYRHITISSCAFQADTSIVGR